MPVECFNRSKKKKKEEKLAGSASPNDWKLGKTTASIQFVRDVEWFLTNCLNGQARALLKAEIEKIKQGEKVLSEITTPEQFLKEHRANE